MADHVIGARLELLQKSDQDNVMEAFYYAGIPFAVWVREAESLDCQETLEDLCQECQLIELLSHIKEKRRKAWRKTNQIGNHLSLLWGEHDLIPPHHLLEMP